LPTLPELNKLFVLHPKFTNFADIGEKLNFLKTRVKS
jgi:hypothetical protein